MDTEDKYTRITLRIPKGLHAQLQKSADDTSKSMNAEIVARLQATFGTPDALIISGNPSSIGSADSLSELRELLEAIHKEVSNLKDIKQKPSKEKN